MQHIWTREVETLLEKTRVNAVNLSEYHRRRFFHYKGFGKYFEIPLLILASLNSTISVGLQPYASQPAISATTCVIGMIMGIITSVKLYLAIEDSLVSEMKLSKDFHILALELFKTLALKPDERVGDGRDYLNKQYSIYIKLVESSNLLKKKNNRDTLLLLPKDLAFDVERNTDGTPTPPTTPTALDAEIAERERTLGLLYDQ
jgi:hypothetical protein